MKFASQSEIRAYLARIGYEQNQLMEVSSWGSYHGVYALEIIDEEAEDLWIELSAASRELGYIPILTCHLPAPGETWEKSVDARDFLERSGFDEEVGVPQTDFVKDLLAMQRDPFAMEKLLKQHNALYSQNPATRLKMAIDAMMFTHGKAPSFKQAKALIATNNVTSYFDMEAFFLTWERMNGFPESYPGPADFSCHDSVGLYKSIILIPCEHTWQVLAYLHWPGATRIGTPTAMAIMHHWNRQYGAELVGHYENTLQLQVESPPTDLDAALKLALEFEAFAPSTTTIAVGSPRGLARTLVDAPWWLIHAYPEESLGQEQL